MITQTLLPFKIEKSKETLTAHAGLAVAHEFNLAAGLEKLLNRHLPPPGSNRGHKPAEWIIPLILMLQGGGNDLNDIRVIAQDTALRRLCNLRKVPDESTLGDLLRRTGESTKAMDGLSDTLTELIHIALLEGKTSDFTFDPDATIIAANKYDAAVAYEGTKGYQPMLGFLAENRCLIYDDFRNGNASPASGILDALKTAQSRMVKGTRIARFRSDSAAYNHEITDYCEKQNIYFAIGADWDSAVTKQYNGFKNNDWTQLTVPRTGKLRETAETIHSFNEGKGSFRLVFVRDVDPQGELFPTGRRGRAVITNLPPEITAAEVINWYNGRGTAENYIKELKYQFGLLGVPCGQLHANAAWCRIAALAYNLFLMQQALGLPEELSASSVATVRWQVYQLAGRIVSHARNTCLRIAADLRTLDVLHGIRAAASRLSVQCGFT